MALYSYMIHPFNVLWIIFNLALKWWYVSKFLPRPEMLPTQVLASPLESGALRAECSCCAFEASEVLRVVRTSIHGELLGSKVRVVGVAQFLSDESDDLGSRAPSSGHF